MRVEERALEQAWKQKSVPEHCAHRVAFRLSSTLLQQHTGVTYWEASWVISPVPPLPDDIARVDLLAFGVLVVSKLSVLACCLLLAVDVGVM